MYLRQYKHVRMLRPNRFSLFSIGLFSSLLSACTVSIISPAGNVAENLTAIADPVCIPSALASRTLLQGQGTLVAPYEIATLADLAEVSNRVLNNNATYGSKSYKLICDIDATVTNTWNSGAGFIPIGDYVNPFTGQFDGNSKTISNLFINLPATTYVGLFAVVGVDDPAADNSAIIISQLNLKSVHITGLHNVGGLAGSTYGGTFRNISTTGTITAYGEGGGIIGNLRSVLLDSYSRADIFGATGYSYLGGLVGVARDNATIIHSYSTGSSPAELNGGLTSQTDPASTIARSYWDIQGSGVSASAGGSGQTSSAMKQQSSYAGWDFTNTWTISPDTNNGYPTLQNKPLQTFALQSGAGTVGDPYLISSAVDLTRLMIQSRIGHNLNAVYKLSNSIDLTGYDDFIFPIGLTPLTVAFSGTFDGNGKTIANLNITSGYSDNLVGLFGEISAGGVVKNLTLSGGTFDLTSGNMGAGGNGGALAGSNLGTIDHCHSSVTVVGGGNLGGLVGSNYATITDSDSSGSVTAAGQGAGGLVGVNVSGPIIRSFATGAVSGTVSSGCNSAGGLVGAFQSGSIADSYATGDVQGNACSVGGLAGDAFSGSITRSYATGNVSSRFNTGGLVGNAASISISDSFATGNVNSIISTGGGFIGGVYPGFSLTATRVYALGNVSGGNTLGGFIGAYSSVVAGSVTQAFSAGIISGTGGGFIGSNAGGLTLTSCYYDTRATLGGAGNSRSTAQMQTQATFAGWAFGTDWKISASQYPKLFWQ